MNRERPEDKWKRLTGLARQSPPNETPADLPPLPPGLATRVAARWAAGAPRRSSVLALFERCSWWGAAVAALACAAWISLSPPSEESSEPLAFDSLLFAPDAQDFGGDPLF